MTRPINKQKIRDALLELYRNEPDETNLFLEEIKAEALKLRRQQLEKIVDEDFSEYAEVFKTLA